jgi:hypothetical protein
MLTTLQVQYVPLPDGMPYDGGLYKQMPGLVRDIKLNVSVVRGTPASVCAKAQEMPSFMHNSLCPCPCSIRSTDIAGRKGRASIRSGGRVAVAQLLLVFLTTRATDDTHTSRVPTSIGGLIPRLAAGGAAAVSVGEHVWHGARGAGQSVGEHGPSLAAAHARR